MPINSCIKNTIKFKDKFSQIISQYFGEQHKFSQAIRSLDVIEKGFLVGAIDLFFCYDNKYWILDYKTSEEQNLETGTKTKINQPKSDVLQFYTKEGAKISVRPSGTEPKIKFYISVNSKLTSASAFDKADLAQEERINKLGAAISQ